jgi:antitoxin component YwqK of YwqJK toxin-antitoxin module
MSEPSRLVPETVLYETGAVQSRGARLDRELHGAWEWFRLDGSLMRTGAFDRGRQVGTWRTFDRAGRMVKETDFKTGR